MKKSSCKIKYLKFSMKLRRRRNALREMKNRPSSPSSISQIPSTLPSTLPTETELRMTLFQLLMGKIRLLILRLYQTIRHWLGWTLLKESSQA